MKQNVNKTMNMITYLLYMHDGTIWHDLHFATKIPEDGAEEESDDSSEKESNGIVRRVPPV